MATRIIIFAPSYSDQSGGVLVLHKLSHLFNCLGYESYIYRDYESYLINRENILKPLGKVLESYLKLKFTNKYKLNPDFNTKLFEGDKSEITDQDIVVYPDIVKGNPLNSSNVVRWMLHKPGYMRGFATFTPGEMYFDYENYLEGFSLPGSRISTNKLFIPNNRLDTYNLHNAVNFSERRGQAYLVRKGRGKKFVHEPDAIQIDGLAHEEIANVFKRVKTFISYDVYSYFSKYAVLCGADSVVIPDDGLDKYSWLTNEESRLGVAYGFDDLDYSRATSSLFRERALTQEEEALSKIKLAYAEMIDFFFAK